MEPRYSGYGLSQRATPPDSRLRNRPPLLCGSAGMLDIPTDFADFDDYWRPFLGGTGPAPGYVASLDEPRRELLRQRLRQRLPSGADGRIPLRPRASVVRGVSS